MSNQHNLLVFVSVLEWIASGIQLTLRGKRDTKKILVIIFWDDVDMITRFVYCVSLKKRMGCNGLGTRTAAGCMTLEETRWQVADIRALAPQF